MIFLDLLILYSLTLATHFEGLRSKPQSYIFCRKKYNDEDLSKIYLVITSKNA